MKKVLFALMIIIIFGYGLPSPEGSQMMPGAYKMLSQLVNDTVVTGTNQLKIYTENYMMYGDLNSRDSVSSFGIGSYSESDAKVIENVIFRGSGNNTTTNEQPVELDIKKTTKGYIQVIPELGQDPGQKIKLTEEYEKVGTTVKSPLDGAWKETLSYGVRGKDTAKNQLTQYKIYYGGNFLWGHTYTDSAKKTQTAVGFGTFKMNGSNKMAETVATCTYSSIVGKTFDIDFTMNGNDQFQLTGTFSPGTKSVEVYQRLKK